MRLVMMGTGPFAVPTFRSLIKSHHAVVALVTGALKDQGKRPAATSPMREAAARYGTPIFDPENVNAPPSQERIGQFEADLLVVCDYGQILSTRRWPRHVSAASTCTPRCCPSTAERPPSTGP